MTLDSLVGHVDEILVVDGPYKDFSNDMCSTDGTLEIAEQYGATIVKGRWESQVHKRQFAADYLQEDDWLLVIDADEQLLNGWWLNDIENSKHDYYSVPLYAEYYASIVHDNIKPDCVLPFVWLRNKGCRLVKNTGYIHYHKRHYYMFRDEQCLWFTADHPISEMSIFHWSIRDRARQDQKNKYYIKRSKLNLEGQGTWTLWHHQNCWKYCKYYGDGPDDYKYCVNVKNGICNATRGNIDRTTHKPHFPDKPLRTEKFIKE